VNGQRIRVSDLPSFVTPNENTYSISFVELKQFGFINMEAHKTLLKNNKASYVKEWGLSGPDFDMAVQEVMDEFEEYHSFTRFHCWVAIKPTVA
jgi:hypothetical protein